MPWNVPAIELSPRASRLETGDYDQELQELYKQTVIDAYLETLGQPTILRRVHRLERFAEDMPIRMEPSDLLVGSMKWLARLPRDVREELGYADSHGHIIHDYPELLSIGIDGFLERISARKERGGTKEQLTALDAFHRAMVAFGRHIERHAQAAKELAGSLAGPMATEWSMWADELASLAHKPPASFRGALQMVWLAQIFLHAENVSAAISFGRLDQYLWPYLKADIETGRLDFGGAADLLAAFFKLSCLGDESQNIAVGGLDAEGEDCTNPLSLLLLQVMIQLRVIQPSLSIRLHPDSPAELLELACRLAATGTGQPGFFNDDVVIPGLMQLGVPLDRARDYGIVGCYEAAPPGDCYPNTVGADCTCPALPRLLVEYLGSDSAMTAVDFRAFLEGWFDLVSKAYSDAIAGQCQQKWDFMRDNAPSAFGSVLLKDCIGVARPFEAGGARFTFFGINILGLGTTIDSLNAINQLAFERKELGLAELAAAVAANFPDERLRRRLLSVPERYGTDSEATNRLAAEISERLAGIVLDSRMDYDTRPYPGYFRFLADIGDCDYATPDGRHAKEPISYGCGPASTCGGTPTSILTSVAGLAHDLCACGNPLALSLDAADVQGSDGIAKLQALVLGYFHGGGFHIHFNTRPAAELRAAQVSPEEYSDLLIRISGFSARFVMLSNEIQDALIERAECGV